ncbi:MAG: FG-GAP repeat protein [Gemmatimonadaceae bacterium]|nr:FG-GAP repeat protein [Gloeobacterales cyanobacterium ES-bin-141]
MHRTWRQLTRVCTGTWMLAMAGVSVAASVNAQAIPGDFNSDGKADILWRNRATGQNVVWLMNGTALTSTVSLTEVTNLDWHSLSGGDFNADGKADILWRNQATGQNVVWLMDGTALTSTVSLTEVTLDWRMSGVGDFNADGKADILWRNLATGQNVVWLMDGTALTSTVSLTAVTNLDWQSVGVGDFNADGKADILWRNRATGQNVVWLMDGTALTSTVSLATVSDLSWRVGGVADFSGDGSPDILWRYQGAGGNQGRDLIWQMRGTSFAASLPLTTVTDLNWCIAGSPIPLVGFTKLGWSTRAPSPVTRSEAQGAVVADLLYVFGGYSNGVFVPISRSDVYDPSTNAWNRIADLPEPLTHTGVTVDGRDIYFAGGYVGNANGGQTFATKSVWKYNVDSDSWTTMPPLPLARGSGALVLLGRDLHFFGGADVNRVDRGDHWVLSLGGSTGWVAAAPLPNPRSHMGYAALGGKIFAVGGQYDVDEDLTSLSIVHVWNPAVPDTWTRVADLPAPRSHISSSTFVMDERIVIAGGEEAHRESVRDVSAYDPWSNTWTALTPLPGARYSGVAGTVGAQVFHTTGSMTSTTYRGIPGN